MHVQDEGRKKLEQEADRKRKEEDAARQKREDDARREVEARMKDERDRRVKAEKERCVAACDSNATGSHAVLARRRRAPPVARSRLVLCAASKKRCHDPGLRLSGERSAGKSRRGSGSSTSRSASLSG